MTEQEIKDNHKSQHDLLTILYYSGESGLTKEAFDIQHGQIWANMEAELIAGGYKDPPLPIRDLAVEVDSIKTRLEVIETTPFVIK